MLSLENWGSVLEQKPRCGCAAGLVACVWLVRGAHVAPAMGFLRIGSCGRSNFKALWRGGQSDRSADGMGVCPEVVSGPCEM